MNLMPFSSGTPPPWFPTLQPVSSASSSFWETGQVHDCLRNLQDTIQLMKTVQKELEVMLATKENNGSLENVDGTPLNVSFHRFSEVIRTKRVGLKLQESLTLEAANSLCSSVKSQLEPFNSLISQTSSWEEMSAAVKVANRIQKSKRNKHWRKRKRKFIAEILSKECERFDQADQEADEWRAREIAKGIARRKVEKMKEIAKLKANEERQRLESELELVLIVERLRELRSIRIQKMKKQGHFLPEEDDKFIERVRSAVEEEERQVAAAAETDAARDAIATAEESRRIIQSSRSDPRYVSNSQGGGMESQDSLTETASEGGPGAARDQQRESDEQVSEGQGFGRTYDSIANLPVEFYHYYHGGNTDMGTLIEVRKTWDAYIRPGGSRIPGHWVQPPPPANEIWASYLIGPK